MKKHSVWLCGISLLVLGLVEDNQYKPKKPRRRQKLLRRNQVRGVQSKPSDSRTIKNRGWKFRSADANSYSFNEPHNGRTEPLMNRKSDHFDLDLANIRIQRVVEENSALLWILISARPPSGGPVYALV